MTLLSQVSLQPAFDNEKYFQICIKINVYNCQSLELNQNHIIE